VCLGGLSRLRLRTIDAGSSEYRNSSEESLDVKPKLESRGR
jgi:hypothetical protein